MAPMYPGNVRPVMAVSCVPTKSPIPRANISSIKPRTKRVLVEVMDSSSISSMTSATPEAAVLRQTIWYLLIHLRAVGPPMTEPATRPKVAAARPATEAPVIPMPSISSP